MARLGLRRLTRIDWRIARPDPMITQAVMESAMPVRTDFIGNAREERRNAHAHCVRGGVLRRSRLEAVLRRSVLRTAAVLVHLVDACPAIAPSTHPSTMETTTLTMPCADKASEYAAHSAQVIRGAIQRELEAELRGLLMAARMQGFRLLIEEPGPRAVALKNPAGDPATLQSQATACGTGADPETSGGVKLLVVGAGRRASV